MDLGGVEGGEGNRVGWMEEGEEGPCLVGEGRGKKGLMGEAGEGEACFVGEESWDTAAFVGEEGEREAGSVGGKHGWAGLVGEDGEGEETGVEAGVQVKRAGGPEGERVPTGKHGAAEGDVGDALISGGDNTSEEGTGKVSAEGEGEN